MYYKKTLDDIYNPIDRNIFALHIMYHLYANLNLLF